MIKSSLLAALLLAASLPASGAELLGIRIGEHSDRLRIVFDVNEPVVYEVDRGSVADTVTVQLQATAIAAGANPAAAAHPGISRILAFDASADSVLLEIDLTQPAVDVVDFPLQPFDGRGHRVVVDLYFAQPTVESVAAASGAIAVHRDSAAPVAAAASSEGEAGAGADDPANTAHIASAYYGGQQTAGPAKTAAGSSSSGSADTSSRFDWSGSWEQELAVTTEDNENQKFEALLEPRLDVALGDSNSLTAIARLRLDTVGDLGPSSSRPDNYSSINGPFYNDEHAEFSLRELYLDMEWGQSWWRLGKQQVVWGQADGIKVLDVVNPQSFREFILDEFDDSRIPLTMVNAELPVGEEVQLQLLWIPDTTYHELAEVDTPYFLTSPLLVPTAPAELPVAIADVNKPDDPISDSDFGTRLSAFVGGWDVSLNYLYHYQDFPVYYQSLVADDDTITATVSPTYERNHLAGATLSNVIGGDFTLRSELAYNSDTFQVANNLQTRGIANSAEFAAVVGLDWSPTATTLVSGQYFHSQLLDYQAEITRDRIERNVSLYLQQFMANESLRMTALLLYSVNRQDSLLQLKLAYELTSQIDIWMGADVLSGDSDGVFGQFKEEDRLLLGFKWGF